MSFVLPLALTRSGIVCRGRVVRAVLPAASDAPRGLAATISAYRFVRGTSTPDAAVLEPRNRVLLPSRPRHGTNHLIPPEPKRRLALAVRIGESG